MYGAILGDMIGAPYEFDGGNKTKEFPLFSKKSEFTDDSVLTVAVAEVFLRVQPNMPEKWIREQLIRGFRKWGKRYPAVGYGERFRWWLNGKERGPYYSCGNGSAMRVSAVAWLYSDLDTVRWAARQSAQVTHNHPEGIKGAEAVASAIYMARTGNSKNEIKEFLEGEFCYDLHRTCDAIRPGYCHIETCQESVPEAIIAFLEGEDFEDVVRTAVSLGGDCDTQAAIAGSIAEGFYGVPEYLKKECRNRLPDDLCGILDEFYTAIGKLGRNGVYC